MQDRSRKVCACVRLVSHFILWLAKVFYELQMGFQVSGRKCRLSLRLPLKFSETLLERILIFRYEGFNCFRL